MAHWTLPRPLSRQVVIDEGATAIVAGGLLAGDVSSDQVVRVSGERGVVARLAPLREPVHDSAGATVAGRATVIGGGGSAELAAVEQLGADRRWRVVGRLPDVRSDLSVVRVPDGILVIGGYTGTSSPREVLKSVDGRHFTVFARLTRGVRYASVAVTATAVWVFGGEDQHHELRTVQRIDLGSRAVSTVASMPHALGHAAVTGSGSRLLLMGGRTSPERVTDQMWWFDPASLRFSRAGRLPYAVADAGVLTDRRDVYLLGGETPAFSRRVTHVRLNP